MIRTLLLALLAAAGVSGAFAQGSYPNKPMRWIIPYAPGGGTDVIARSIAQKLAEVLGQPIVYENRSGGGGLIAAELVAKSAPDGYTLLVGANNTHLFPTLLYAKIPFDPVKDYAPITNCVAATKRLAVLPDLPAFSESSLPGFVSSSFYGLLAPAGTPRPIINKLHAELVKVIHSPESVVRLADAGAFPVANTPEQFAEENRREVVKWGKIVKDHGIKAD